MMLKKKKQSRLPSAFSVGEPCLKVKLKHKKPNEKRVPNGSGVNPVKLE